jgi:hypothetical protein
MLIRRYIISTIANAIIPEVVLEVAAYAIKKNITDIIIPIIIASAEFAVMLLLLLYI